MTSLAHSPERNSCDIVAPCACSFSFLARLLEYGERNSPKTKVTITNSTPMIASIRPTISVDMLETRMMVNSERAANCASA